MQRRTSLDPTVGRTTLKGYVTDRILADAGTMMPTELRSLDAIHLATWQLGASLARAVTYDERLSAAAAAMGRSVMAPS